MRVPTVLALTLAVGACAGNDTTARDAERSTMQSATVSLAPTQGHQVKGELALSPVADGVRISGTLSGLTPGAEQGFHVHEKGDCSAADASSAGAHFNPAGAPHGNAAAGAHHAGDMANLHADASGNAKVNVTLRGVSLGGANDIVGRALIVHADPDDYVSQPSGNAGARVACGVIAGAT